MALIDGCFGCTSIICFLLICEQAVKICPCRICIIKPICKKVCENFINVADKIKYEKGITWYDKS